MPRPSPLPLRLQLLLRACVYMCVCARMSIAAATHSLPWRVPCPVRCACQIKPWFSPESVYREAPTVDCNDQLLTQLPAVLPRDTHTLRLQSNLLSSLEGSALHALPNLTELDLSQNRFGGGGLRSLAQNRTLPSLLCLYLEENRLAQLPRGAFSAVPALQELFLSHNRLRSLAPGVFSGLDALRRLHLNNNRLASVDPRWFAALPRLEVLMLGGNPVETLPERGFRALGSLRSLVLRGMGLRGLPDGALDGLDGLESLSLYDNLLTAVPARALSRARGLKFLDLNKNRIALLQTGDFRDMVHLKELGLNNMEELVSIESGALENLPELTKLEITNNPRLSYVHPRAFLQLGRLESLMLNSNALSGLHWRTLLSLPSLQEVSLHSNPLRCDCLFRWAAEGYADADGARRGPRRAPRWAVRFIQPQATLCWEPPELKARSVRELSPREMSASCLPLIPPGSLPTYVGVREGAGLALHCRALAEPQPRLYWVTPDGVRLGPAPARGHHAANYTPESRPSPAPSRMGTTAAAAASHQYDRTRPPGHAPSIPLPGPSHYRVLPEGTLEIATVTPKEAGLYTCVAENELGVDTRSVTVGVHGRRRGGGSGGAGRAGLALAGSGGMGAVQVREVGRGYAVLAVTTGRNLPQAARLSWHATRSETHGTADARGRNTHVLAGNGNVNLTHLLPGTRYCVCLHASATSDAVGEGGAGPRGATGGHGSSRLRRESGGRRPRCVTLRTADAPEPEPDLTLSPELTSTTLMLLTAAMLLLAVQACQREAAGVAAEKPPPWEGKGHKARRMMTPEEQLSSANQMTRSCQDQQKGRGEESLQPACC